MALTSKQWGQIGAGFLLLVVIGVIIISFLRKRENQDTAVIDAKISMRDSVIAAKEAHIQSLQAENVELKKENQEFKLENRKLKDQYISNQEKHVIINQKKNEINPAVTTDRELLRRESMRTGDDPLGILRKKN